MHGIDDEATVRAVQHCDGEGHVSTHSAEGVIPDDAELLKGRTDILIEYTHDILILEILLFEGLHMLLEIDEIVLQGLCILAAHEVIILAIQSLIFCICPNGQNQRDEADQQPYGCDSEQKRFCYDHIFPRSA